MSDFIKVSPFDLPDNFFDAISRETMLITAADANGRINTMTASWGGTGFIWRKPVFFCVIRPQRHTFSFTEHTDGITLSFLGDGYRRELAFCGSKSGRDCDKFAETGLTPVIEGETAYIGEARMVIVGRKLYADWLKKECFTDAEIPASCYPEEDYHRVYVCEIKEVRINNQK